MEEQTIKTKDKKTNNMKKQLYRAALLATLGLAGVTAAQAQSEMVLGMNDANYYAAPAGYDYTIDLGSAANFTTSYSGSWSISSSLFNTAFGADTSALNDVAVGVIGSLGSANAMQTILNVNPGTSTANISSASSFPATIPFGVNAYATSPGWSQSVAINPSSPGASTSSSFAGATANNPMQYLASGTVSEILYTDSNVGSGRNAHTSGWTEVGTFTIDANNDTITFNGSAVSVPEPTTYGLLAGAGPWDSRFAVNSANKLPETLT